MKTLILILSLAIVGGCASGPNHEEYLNYDAKVIEKTQASLIAEDCGSPTVQIPGTTLTYTAKTCGLLFDVTIKGKQLEREICPTFHLKGKACEKRAAIVFLERVADRYKLADINSVSKWCDMYPVECINLRTWELKMLHSHNTQVGIDSYEARADIRKRYNSEKDDASERNSAGIAAFFGSVGNSLSKPETKHEPIKTIDQNCMTRCQNAGSNYQFCQSKCEY